MSTTALTSMLAISPIDGRYRRFTSKLVPIASEFGLIRYRIEVMIRYVTALTDMLSEHTDVSPLGTEIHRLFEQFSTHDALLIKKIETQGIGAGEVAGWDPIPALNHDVKACELWIRHQFRIHGLSEYIELIHFGCTSEDVNNIAYGLMFRDMLAVTMPSLMNVLALIDMMAQKYAGLAMLARTHGQAATPTTLGKELTVFSARVSQQMRQFSGFEFRLKLNGASGTYAAMYAAYPQVDWQTFSKDFIERKLPAGPLFTFVQSEVTTQVEPHDVYAEFFGIVSRMNTILVGFCQDIWRYISDEWLVQVAVPGEVGSSTMPHKVNPINFENAEGNLLLACWIMEGCCRKLPISRLQRDLSDSTVERAFGTIFGHCIVAYENIAAGMRKISANQDKIAEALAAHPEVLSEAYMTILRSIRYPGAYDVVKQISRGKKITMSDLHAFVDALDGSIVSMEEKQRMKAIRPDTYHGVAESLVRAART